MSTGPKILIIGKPQDLVPPAYWTEFQSRYHIRSYEYPTLDDFHQSLRDGDCKNVVAIVRTGLNLLPGIERPGQGWTKRALPYYPPSLRLIVNFGHGYDEEDIPALESRGISFANTTGGSEATATIGTFLIISSLRQLSRYERMLRNDEYLPALRDSARNALDPFGRRLGIVGMGAVGQTLARQAAVLGMEIHCVDRPSIRKVMGSLGNNKMPPLALHKDLETLVANVDCVALACSYSPETHHLLSREVFSKMRPGIRIVNIARGKCIDEEALCEAIESGIVGGAGLDVHYNEPNINPRLLKYECVTLLPHVGGLTQDSMRNHATLALQAVDRFLMKPKDNRYV